MKNNEESGVRIARLCPCGAGLQAAYNSESDRVFWNCFVCFPFFEPASQEQIVELKNQEF